MIEILANKISEKQSMRWINVTNAKKKEIEYLKKNFNFDLKHLRDSLGNIYAQRLKIEENKNYLFLILRFPRFDEEAQEIVASEVDCFIGKNYLITVHNRDLKDLNGLFNLCKKDKESLGNYLGQDPLHLLHAISNRSLNECFNILDAINVNISEVEEQIFSGQQEESINDIMILKHNVINFRRIMRSHRSILRKLIVNHKKFVKQTHISLYNSLIQHTIDIWDMAKNQKEMIEALEYTNDSKVSFKMNDVMKTLTIFSVIVFPLTFIASLFGMNTMKSMPLLDTPNDFWIIIGVMLTGVLITFGFFKKKGWI
ncbi:magnesium transporter CorA family protein [Candidatus Falkowbacteria bacterium]|mgnify:CR=1 FL=1|jgi:magnesium transporter|nr:magnesium transporter CorA family protein [Candidatus Falkowbacteria bacterium]MBT4432902.1 magnesium transporter CorA family protein [Candidatus Falkowbacteria bacterium]